MTPSARAAQIAALKAAIKDSPPSGAKVMGENLVANLEAALERRPLPEPEHRPARR